MLLFSLHLIISKGETYFSFLQMQQILKTFFFLPMKKYNTGAGNPAKKLENRKKISEALLGKSKRFKDGKNLRRLDRKVSSSGHILKWVEDEKKHIQEHRLVYAEGVGLHHSQINEIHHLNGDKKDNRFENLIELNDTTHSLLHSQIEKLAFELVRSNHIVFNKECGEYRLSPMLEMDSMEKSFGFDQVAIKQEKNICKSRLDVNIESEFVRGFKLKIPLIASNMSTVVNADFCILLYRLGAFGIMHRADTESNILKEVKKISKECDMVGSSIGIEKNQFDFAKKLISAGSNIITIDIAHGYSDTVLELAKKIKLYSSETKLIIGNVTNPNIMYECYDFVDGVKVGIAQGLACETKNTAGCTEKQFSAILKFKHLSKNFGIPVISDGGVREAADFTKAIAAGAGSVMAGSIFAKCPESASETILIDDVPKKLYAGMASEYVQTKWKGGLKPGTCSEGGIRYLDEGLPAEKLLELYSGALRSGITYAGGTDLISFQNNVKFIKID